jgi:hypothetical protein
VHVRGLAERLVSHMPAAREGLPEGDFRDWPEVEVWRPGSPVISSPCLLTDG